MEQTISLADFSHPEDAKALRQLMQEYACDPMGGGKALNDDVLEVLPEKLRANEKAYTVIAWMDNEPVGLVNSFEGFSTFKAKPLVNIHDVIVTKSLRGQGIAQKMLEAVEQEAIKRGCCKLTLEVLEGNKRAQQVYLDFGFAGYELDPSCGQAVFWEKQLK
jgi:GNAT superfamily N-acetyltransferase